MALLAGWLVATALRPSGVIPLPSEVGGALWDPGVRRRQRRRVQPDAADGFDRLRQPTAGREIRETGRYREATPRRQRFPRALSLCAPRVSPWPPRAVRRI